MPGGTGPRAAAGGALTPLPRCGALAWNEPWPFHLRLPNPREVASPMADHDLETPRSAASSPTDPPAIELDTDADAPLLARLNRRGFRLVMLLDVTMIYAVTVAIMFVRFGTRWPTFPIPTYLGSFAVATAIFTASLYFGGLYEREPRLGAPPNLPRGFQQTLAAGGVVALLTLALTGVAREFGLTTARALPFPILNLAIVIVLGAIVVSFNRTLVHRVRTHREGPPKIVVAGDEHDRAIARDHLAIEEGRCEVVAEVEDPAILLAEVGRTSATDVVVVTSGWLDDLYPEAVEALDQAHVTMLLRVTGRETLFGLQRLREVGGLPFVLLRGQTMPRSRMHYKRLFDLTVLAVAAPVCLVALGVMALYQSIVAGRPLLYRQERVGAQGRHFAMLKFRTMVVDAEADGRGARLAETDDPRVIPACRWVRATRMDELPQLWNVLRGEMSLVGPRPERPELTATFEQQIPGYARRHELPPGLTGLAQIHGRYHTDPEYKLGYDLQYLVNWSPVLDLEILARTIWVVAARRL
jgi:lipopolysaccharide/colanic/teichoic acid biosynthesis glycosyltransferase